MTDADLLPRGRDRVRRFWEERLRDAPLTRTRWASPDGAGEVQVRPCGTARLDRVCGPGWLAAGDAAVAFDPLSSQGILKALESGRRAGEVAAAVLRGDGSAPSGYAEWLDAEFAAYARDSARYYAQVARWPDSTFWRRRQPPRPAEQPAGVAGG
jgi:flavin-dependent dehydrogenase